MTKSRKFMAKVGLIVFPTALISASFPLNPAWGHNQFDVCVQDLVNSGVTAEQAGTACADALIPKELSECVSMIRSRTAVDPNNALAACYRVRRPVDLANCVIDIDHALLHSQTKVTPSPATEKTVPETVAPTTGEGEDIINEEQKKDNNKESSPNTETKANLETDDPSPLLVALDSCRKSLLPGRYSECVTGLSRSASLPPVAAMNTCLDAQAYPVDIFPVYNPE